jgi:BclB C-terminal domain-containing protein
VTGPTGGAGLASIIPFATGAPDDGSGAQLISLLAPVPAVALIGFGSSFPNYTLTTPGVITLTPATGNFSFMAPRDGVVTSISAFFNIDVALTLLATGTVTVQAELWISPNTVAIGDPNNTFVPTGVVTTIPFTVPVGLILPAGTFGSSTSAAGFPVTSGSRLLMVFSVISPTTVLPIAFVVEGAASAGITFE